MKTIFMIYCILFRNVSIIATKENIDNCLEPTTWNAHTGIQGGYGGHNSKWASAPTKQEAVWRLFHS